MEQDECAARFRFQPIGFKIQEKREGKPVKCGFSKTIILDDQGLFRQDEVDEVNYPAREARGSSLIRSPKTLKFWGEWVSGIQTDTETS